MRDLSLGIDTSNYKTSVALVDREGNLVFNHQKFLEVKDGELGLRQQEAFFQHVQRLPDVISEVLNNYRDRIGSVSASSRPRPVEGSYMPVFTAGTGFGKSVGASLGVPYNEFSHQEGHFEAVRFYSEIKDDNPMVFFHFSGGTTEAILVDREENKFELIGGSKDISYGQLIDRIGVLFGMYFPCGEELDKLATENKGRDDLQDVSFKKIKVTDGYVNLSGIETQAKKAIDAFDKESIAVSLFNEISASILSMVMELSDMYKVKSFMFSGGVSCSNFVRAYLKDKLPKDIRYSFGEPRNSSDNAIGIALLGGRNIWL